MSDGATQATPTSQPESELFYQAIGTVEGILQEQEDNKWSLSIGEQSFGVWIKKLHILSNYIEPGSLQRFRVYPRQFSNGSFYFTILHVLSQDAPLGFTLRGCWVRPSYDVERTCLIVHRNERHSERDLGKSVHLRLNWANAPEPDGQYWIVSAQFDGTEFVVSESQGPFPPPLNWFEKRRQQASLRDGRKPPRAKPKRKLQSSTGQGKSVPSAPPQVVVPLTVQEIRSMAVPTKMQVTCRISEVPPHREVDKMVEFFLSEGDGRRPVEDHRIFTVRIKPKQFKKLTSHGFEQWVAAISGSLGPATETGFELVNASIQVFEKKAKATDDKPEKTKGKKKQSASDSTGKAPKDSGASLIEQHENPPTKKRLMDTVRIR